MVISGFGSDVGKAGRYTIIHRTAGDGATVAAAGDDGVTLLSLRFPTETETE